jgi:hypothetical protein
MRKQKTVKQVVKELAPLLVAESIDHNQAYAHFNGRNGNVMSLTGAHYNNIATQTYGLEQLIERILLKAGATGLSNVSLHGKTRQVIIDNAMFFNDIYEKVHAVFPRYSANSIRVYLSTKATWICSLQTVNLEDPDRECPKPRTKYYLDVFCPFVMSVKPLANEPSCPAVESEVNA